MDRPLVSIIMPAFNAAPYLEEAIASVLAQSYPNWELIAVNDGSTDDTARILESYADPRIRVIHQENKGVGAARNAALDVSKGELITFLDADDVLPEKALASRVEYFRNHAEVDVADGCISARTADMSREIRSYVPYHTGPLFPRLIALDDRVFFGPFYMVRRRIVQGVHFRERLTHAEDLIFFMEMADLHDAMYGHVTDPVYIYRVNENSAMSNVAGIEAGYLKVIEVACKLKKTSVSQCGELRRKIALILFKTWLRRGNLLRAFTVIARIMKA